MRASLIEIKQIEDYLFRRMGKEDSLVFEAKLLLDDELRQKMLLQKKTYELVTLYSRKRLKEEIEEVHNKLFREPEHESFREKIVRLFSKR